MSQNDPADRKTAQAFGFHQLRQACEISSLRQEITRILAGTADLHILIENEVDRVRQRLGALDTADSQDAARLSPLLSDAMVALIEIRDASRRLETLIIRRTQDSRPPEPRSQSPAADLIEQTLRRPFTDRQPPTATAAAEPPAPPPPRPAPVREPPPPPAYEPRLAPPAPKPPFHAASQPAAPRPPTNTAKVMNWLAPTKR